MASGDEDVDLQTLRNAVLATLKSSSHTTEVKGKVKDDDDLEVLRQAALYSKKISDSTANNFVGNSNNFHLKHKSLHNNPRNERFLYRRSNPNLIQINTIPLDEPNNNINIVRPHTFRPNNASRSHVKEETSSTQIPKPKSTSKFSRFESDSESDDDSDYDFLLHSTSEDSSNANDDAENGELKCNVVEEDSGHSSEQNSDQSSDKENEENETQVTEKSPKDESESAKQSENNNSTSEDKKNEISSVEQASKNDNNNNDAREGADETQHSRHKEKHHKKQPRHTKENNYNSEDVKMEARRRKFESHECVVPDKSVKISLKKIIRPNPDSDDRERRSRKRRKSRERSTKIKKEESSNKGLSFTDSEQDLRVSLKQRHEEKRNESRKKKRKSVSPNNGKNSNSPSCRLSPAIKSVLSVVKVETPKRKRRRGGKERRRSPEGQRRKRCSPPIEDQSEQSSSKLPVRLRLGLPVSKSNTSDAEGTSSRPTSPWKRESSSYRSKKSTRSCKKRNGTRAVFVDGVREPITAPGDTQFTVNYDLEAKIRRIREQNLAIMRRREEVAADRKIHT